VVKIFGPREEAITLVNRKLYEELPKAYTIYSIMVKCKFHLRTAHEGPKGE